MSTTGNEGGVSITKDISFSSNCGCSLWVIDSINDNIAEVTLDSGEKVSALAVNVEEQGERTTLSIRPERVIINPDESQVAFTLNGHVLKLIYLGDHIRCRMTVAGNEDFIIKVPNASGKQPLTVGDHVHVSWLPEDCRALDAD